MTSFSQVGRSPSDYSLPRQLAIAIASTMSTWSDVRSHVTDDGCFGIKLCTLGGRAFIDFRELYKNGSTLIPSKKGICFPVNRAADFKQAFSDLLERRQDSIQVGYAELSYEEDGIKVVKGEKMCKVSFEHCTFVLNNMDDLENFIPSTKSTSKRPAPEPPLLKRPKLEHPEVPSPKIEFAIAFRREDRTPSRINQKYELDYSHGISASVGLVDMEPSILFTGKGQPPFRMTLDSAELLATADYRTTTSLGNDNVRECSYEPDTDGGALLSDTVMTDAQPQEGDLSPKYFTLSSGAVCSLRKHLNSMICIVRRIRFNLPAIEKMVDFIVQELLAISARDDPPIPIDESYDEVLQHFKRYKSLPSLIRKFQTRNPELSYPYSPYEMLQTCLNQHDYLRKRTLSGNKNEPTTSEKQTDCQDGVDGDSILDSMHEFVAQGMGLHLTEWEKKMNL